MEAYVNQRCIGCGLCSCVCPGAFYMKEGLAHAYKVIRPESETMAQSAAEQCPVGAIELGETI